MPQLYGIGMLAEEMEVHYKLDYDENLGTDSEPGGRLGSTTLNFEH